jgi:flagellar protein FlgJ
MIPVGTSPAAFDLGIQPSADERQKLADAAVRFEAIFARQMLSAARQARFDNGGLFESQGTETFRQMMDDRFADVLAESGALGFGKIIEAQLVAHVAPAAAATEKEA